MSTEALNWAFAQPVPTSPKFVLVVLADHADQAHSCFPSISRICERTALSRSTVQSALKRLEETGYLRVERRQRPNGSDTSSRYYLAAPNPLIDDAVRPSGGARDLDPPRPAVGPPPARQLDPHNHHKEPPSKSLLIEGIENLFKEAWNSWPNKSAKAEALAKFKAAVKAGTIEAEALQQLIITHGVAYSKSGREVRFIPHLSTWLNGARWTEEPVVPETRPKGSVAAAADVINHFRGR